MMGAFKYGKLANEDYFTNREKESRWLETQINNGTNTMLISPRRWGKSSLILHVVKRIQRKNKQIAFCYIDLYNIRTEQEFLQLYSSIIIRATSDSYETSVRNVKNSFKTIIPTISISPDAANEIELSFNWKQLKKDYSEVLDLPDKIAKQKMFR